MNQLQLARYKAYTVALAHLKENEEITKDVPAFAKVYGNIKALLDNITVAGNLQEEKQQAVSTGKYEYQAAIGQQALTIAAAIVTYAVSIKDGELKESMNFTRTELSYVTDAELGARASNILTTAKKLEEPLQEYGVSAEMIASLARLTEQYLPEANKTRTHTARRKNATQQIGDAIKQAQELMDNQLDKLMIRYQVSNPEFYNQYIINRTVINPARRKTRLEGVTTDGETQTGLGDVLVMVEGSNLVTTTLADGSYSLKVPPMSGATIIFQKDGYVTQKLVLDIKRGQAVKQEVVLVKSK